MTETRIRVIAAVIERQGRVLICERPRQKRHGGLWEFPGGKIESAETDLEAARRELHEELAVNVTEIGEVLYAVEDPGSHFVIEFFRVSIEGDPQALEHSRIEWVDEQSLLEYALAPSDRRYVQHRLANGGNSTT
jgi:mutator protein MutT